MQDGKDGKIKAGAVVKCELDRCWYLEETPAPTESEGFLIEDANSKDGLWMKGITGQLVGISVTLG